VLKIGVPNPELASEIAALDFYAGRGACRLLNADATLGLLLLERLTPGTMLVTLENDDEATSIAAQVLRLIQHTAPGGKDFIPLKKWFDGLTGLRARFNGSTGPFPPKTVEIIEHLIPEIFNEDRPQVLLHGDFHHYNILNSERGWLVIDPKGVIGAAEYEVGPFLVNPIEVMPDETEAIRRTQRRIAIFAEQLGFDRQRLLRWATCFSLLSSWWDVDENGKGGEFSRAWTEIFLKTRV
jgi:streptomycin 6-kinase